MRWEEAKRQSDEIDLERSQSEAEQVERAEFAARTEAARDALWSDFRAKYEELLAAPDPARGSEAISAVEHVWGQVPETGTSEMSSDSRSYGLSFDPNRDWQPIRVYEVRIEFDEPSNTRKEQPTLRLYVVVSVDESLTLRVDIGSRESRRSLSSRFNFDDGQGAQQWIEESLYGFALADYDASMDLLHRHKKWERKLWRVEDIGRVAGSDKVFQIGFTIVMMSSLVMVAIKDPADQGTSWTTVFGTSVILVLVIWLIVRALGQARFLYRNREPEFESVPYSGGTGEYPPAPFDESVFR